MTRSPRLSLVKRLFDVIVSTVVLISFSWLILILALLVRLNLGAPVFFRQKRPGLDGKIFEMVKFRTMRNATSSDGTPLPDDQRMTKFGNLLRKLSLDELPELWNVVKGDMSLVGPRPLLVQYLDRYSPRQMRRHETRPGVTGWAQVNGRNAVAWEDRFEMDVWYVENWSFALDLKILWMTVLTVFKRSGVSAEGHVTMPEFMGSQQP
ncbi:MAG: sugar transferase [Armatimonadetes bacterium]|nr:sugar transferase [Armatimonadota bacterium]